VNDRGEEIYTAVHSAARDMSLTRIADDVACYLLRIDGRLRLETIAEEMGVSTRAEVLRRLNRISIAVCRNEAHIQRLLRVVRRKLEKKEDDRWEKDN
jgi:hypothetical protein